MGIGVGVGSLRRRWGIIEIPCLEGGVREGEAGALMGALVGEDLGDEDGGVRVGDGERF